MLQQVASLVIAITLATMALSVVAVASPEWDNCTMQMIDPSFNIYTPPGAIKLCREGFLAIAYDPQMINPAVSLYYITPENQGHIIPGRDGFYLDPDLKAMGITQASVKSSIFNTSWNRGHLAPSRAMSYTKESKKSCYTMANVAPQWGYFNQQPWEHLEAHVSDFVAKGTTALYIVTGIAYKDRAAAPRGPDNIAYPTWYFKVICDPVTGNAAGFYGVNDAATTANVEFIPVAQIEGMYGGPLFPTDKCNVNTVNRSFWWTV